MDNRVLLSRQFTVIEWVVGAQTHPNYEKEKKIVKLYPLFFLKLPIEVKFGWDFAKKMLSVSQILSHERN